MYYYTVVLNGECVAQGYVLLCCSFEWKMCSTEICIIMQLSGDPQILTEDNKCC